MDRWSNVMPTPVSPPNPAPASGMAATARAGMQLPREEEPRTLVVGPGISVHGVVQNAERLVVEGTVDASMIHAKELSVAQGGLYKGSAEVDDAEIAGTLDGTLTARRNLVVQASGKLVGKASYHRLQVMDGGQIDGALKLTTAPASPLAAPPRNS